MGEAVARGPMRVSPCLTPGLRVPPLASHQRRRSRSARIASAAPRRERTTLAPSIEPHSALVLVLRQVGSTRRRRVRRVVFSATWDSSRLPARLDRVARRVASRPFMVRLGASRTPAGAHRALGAAPVARAPAEARRVSRSACVARFGCMFSRAIACFGAIAGTRLGASSSPTPSAVSRRDDIAHRTRGA